MCGNNERIFDIRNSGALFVDGCIFSSRAKKNSKYVISRRNKEMLRGADEDYLGSIFALRARGPLPSFINKLLN